MDQFRIALISIGVFAIVGILAHGMWTIRKNNKSKEDENASGKPSRREAPKVAISDDDPLLSDTFDKEAFEQKMSDQKPVISKPADHAEPTDTEVYDEVDPLVGDVPLYDSSDINSGIQQVVRKPSPQTMRRDVQEQSESQSQDEPHQELNSAIDFDASTDNGDVDYDADGIGAVRVVSGAPAPRFTIEPVTESSSEVEAEESNFDSEPVEDDVPEPPGYLLKKDEPAQRKVSADDMAMIDTSIDVDDDRHLSGRNERLGALKNEHTRTEVVGGNRMGKKSESIAEKAMKFVGRVGESKSDSTPVEDKPKKAPPKKAPAANKKHDKDQIRLDLEVSPESDEHGLNTPQNDVQANSAEDNAEDQAPQQEVLILNVRVPEGKVIQGSVLLPSLLTLGFKFGEHNMFHRHAASNGKGPRLFTLANMFAPGTFDIDDMENFNTSGVSLFMTLPIEADAHQVFNMMHNAARKLADEFGAQVLDGRRGVLNRQSLQQYVEKIREFERRRMIRRN